MDLNDCPIVTISAHNLSGIMGHDKYKTRSDVLVDMWKRYNPGGHRRFMSGADFDYAALERSLGFCTQHDACKRILDLMRGVDSSNLDVDRIKQLYNYAATQRSPCLNIVKRAVDRLRGLKLQDESLTAALETGLLKGKMKGMEVWRSRTHHFDGIGSVCIGGYADMTLDDGRAVECKVRTGTRIMETAPARDLIQLASYGDKGVLIERVGQQLVERELDTENWWKMEAAPAVKSFMRDLKALLTNTASTSLIQGLRQDRRDDSQWLYAPPQASSARIGYIRCDPKELEADGSARLGGNKGTQVRENAQGQEDGIDRAPKDLGQAEI